MGSFLAGVFLVGVFFGVPLEEPATAGDFGDLAALRRVTRPDLTAGPAFLPAFLVAFLGGILMSDFNWELGI